MYRYTLTYSPHPWPDHSFPHCSLLACLHCKRALGCNTRDTDAPVSKLDSMDSPPPWSLIPVQALSKLLSRSPFPPVQHNSKRRRRRRGSPPCCHHARGGGRFPVLLPMRARNRLWVGPTKRFRVGRYMANRRSIPYFLLLSVGPDVS